MLYMLYLDSILKFESGVYQAEQEYKQFNCNIHLSVFDSEWLAFHPIFYGNTEWESSVLEMCNFDMGLVMYTNM